MDVNVATTKEDILLSVRDLRVDYVSGGEEIHAVNGLSFDLGVGKAIGLVGETGAGKTTIAKAIMRVLPDHATKSVEGEIILEGTDLLKLSEDQMLKHRGETISMVFQDPMTALNPTKTVVDQIAEGIRAHQNLSRSEANKVAIKMLETVGISSDRAEEYPHQFSGGMKQRVVIAIALVCNPKLLIADEPTTALDVTIQAQVLDLIKKLKEQFKTSMILITHDLGVVAHTCDSIAVVYAGKVLEYGLLEDVFDHPSHPYTLGLFNSLPDLSKTMKRLSPIAGQPPDPSNLPEGCVFAPRCPYATERCHTEVPESVCISETHTVCCNRFEQKG